MNDEVVVTKLHIFHNHILYKTNIGSYLGSKIQTQLVLFQVIWMRISAEQLINLQLAPSSKFFQKSNDDNNNNNNNNNNKSWFQL